jgi:hypothetical protein
MKRLAYLFCFVSALCSVSVAQRNPLDPDYPIVPWYQLDPDGSRLQHANLGGHDYQNECGNQFSIQPTPIIAPLNTTVPITFFVPDLGGPNVFDKGRLDYQTVVTDSAWNIQSGGSGSWWIGGPSSSFSTGTKKPDGTYQLVSSVPAGISQTLQSAPYATAGCYVLTAIMQGDFKHKSSTPNQDGSYRCVIEQAAVVQVPLPSTSVDCGAIPGAWPDPSQLSAKFIYVADEGDDLHRVIKKIYSTYLGTGFTARRQKKLYAMAAGNNKPVINGHPEHLKRGAKLSVPDPAKVP